MDLYDKMLNLRKAYDKESVGHKLEEKKEFSLVRSILTKYNLPVNNFDNNLGTLIINEKYNEDSSFEKNEFISGSYYYKNNLLNLPDNTGDFVHELFHMASNDMSKSSYYEGCRIRKEKGIFGTSLNEGITDYFTSLALPDYKSKYPFERLIASYIAKIYGMDIFREHFNGDAIAFYSSFKQDEPFIRNIVMFLDNYHAATQYFYLSGKKIDKEYSDKVSDFFIDFVCEFIKLLQLKKIDESEFLKDLMALMNSDDTYVNLINVFFEFSTYKGKENIFKTIKEEIGEEEFNL